MIRLDWKLTLIKQINQSLDSEPSEFNGTNLTNFRSIKFVGKIDYNNPVSYTHMKLPTTVVV